MSRLYLLPKGQRIYHRRREHTQGVELSVPEMVEIIKSDPIPMWGECLMCGESVALLIEGLWCKTCIASSYKEVG